MRKILIAGARSLIGRALIDRLISDEDLEIIAVSRGQKILSDHPRLTWKNCDLYSLAETREAMYECSEAYYLVDARLPSAALVQGAEEDLAMILADNFVRAAKAEGIARITYLGQVSSEVQTLFQSSGIPTSVLMEGENQEELQTVEPKTVRSIQRMPLPPGRNAEWVALEYMKWLPNFFSRVVNVKIEGERCIFYLVRESVQLLILESNSRDSSPDRKVMNVAGGMLATKGKSSFLEFREVLGGKYILAALHDFRPTLPWWIYRSSQAIIHLLVMKAFGEHLKWHVISHRGEL